MLALALALFAFGPAGQNRFLPPSPKVDPVEQDDRTVSPITVTGKTDKGERVKIVIDMPADDRTRGEFVSIWPVAAYRKGTEGRVTLSCRINVHGLAEVCGMREA